MNSLINTLFNDIHRITPSRNSRVRESGDVYTSEIELPGFSKKDITVRIADDILSVTAKNKDRQKEFKLYLNNMVSEDHITAELKYGLLKLTLPKRTVSDGREVEIK
jgi:HSP20 family molecular chaperone IbpA|tara:strand:+ start:842 stop:1162 length:321 start_codon:yes stop_codon:yes gene_type:complete